jgi:hypothetical protein
MVPHESILRTGGSAVALTDADEKVIRRIREGAYRAYPEQRYVDPAIVPGCVIIGAFGGAAVILQILSLPSVPWGLLLAGTLAGICLLIPGFLVWLHYRNAYSYLGLKRYQVALSITALDLSNHGYREVQSIVGSGHPEEYQYLGLFSAAGPWALLHRLQGANLDAETLARMRRQNETYFASNLGFVGCLGLLGGLTAFSTFALLYLRTGIGGVPLLMLGFSILLMSTAVLIYARLKLRHLGKQEPASIDTTELSPLTGEAYPKCRVENVISLLRPAYPHPIRLLVLEEYQGLEYTGRKYHTGDDIELREAILLPSSHVQ